MNKLEYINKPLDLVNNVSKFKLCDSKQSDRVKVESIKLPVTYERYTPHFYKIRRKVH